MICKNCECNSCKNLENKMYCTPCEVCKISNSKQKVEGCGNFEIIEKEI